MPQNRHTVYLVKPHPPEEILHGKTPIPEHYKYNWEPLVLKLAAYYLNRDCDGTHNTKIWHLFDTSDDTLFLDSFAKEKPHILVFTEIDLLIPEVNRLSRLCRERKPDVVIVICGKHSSLLRPGDRIPFGEADYILGGDALRTLPALLNKGISRENKFTLPPLPGAVHFDQEGMVQTVYPQGKRTDFSDLIGFVMRKIPVANRRMEEYYPHQSHPALINGEIRTAPLFIGTGCPHHCSVCQSPIEYGPSSQTLYLRSPEAVSEEIVSLVKEYGMNNFFSLEPNMNLRNLKKIYQSLSDKGISHLGISGFVRAADVCHAGQTGLLQELADSGMRVLSIGLDIPMDTRQDKYNKQYSYDEMMECLRFCRETGILLLGTIVCDPEMTEKQLASLLETAGGLPVASIDIRLAIPLRNTSYFKEVKEFLIHHPDEGDKFFSRQNYRYQTIQFPGKITPHETYGQVNLFLNHFLRGETHIRYVEEMAKNYPETIPFFREQYSPFVGSLGKEERAGLAEIFPPQEPSSQNTKGSSYYDKVAGQYDAAFSDITVRKAEISWLENRLPEDPFSLLEVGCGGGALLHHFRDRISSGVGIDTSQELIRKARERHATAAHIQFFCIKEGSFPDFGKRRFHRIISLLSWRYLDWNGLWPELLKVLSPGGKILVVDMVRSAGTVQDFLPALSDRIQVLLSSRNTPFKEELKKLVRNRDWQEMLAAHPMRPWEEYARFFQDHAPGAAIQILNRTLKSKIIGCDSGPLLPYGTGKVAILDWGIGGFGLVSLIKKEYPHATICYFSDSGFTPYGKCSRPQLVRRLEEILHFLADRGITHLAVACNAMSTALEDPSLNIPRGIQIQGVIRPTIEELKKVPPLCLGVIGGHRTIDSRSYESPLSPVHRVLQNSAQPLSALIEQGGENQEALIAVIREATAPLKECSALVLGCTHYPAVLPLFETILPGMQFFDPAAITYATIRDWPFQSRGEEMILTTGQSDEMRIAAKKVFSQEIGLIHPLQTDLTMRPSEGPPLQ